jgi:hypothetical protein
MRLPCVVLLGSTSVRMMNLSCNKLSHSYVCSALCPSQAGPARRTKILAASFLQLEEHARMYTYAVERHIIYLPPLIGVLSNQVELRDAAVHQLARLQHDGIKRLGTKPTRGFHARVDK